MVVSISKSDYTDIFFGKINQYNQDIVKAFSDVFNDYEYPGEELLRLQKLFLTIRGYASRTWRLKQQNSVRSCLEDILSFLRSLKSEKSCENGEFQTIYRIDEIEIKQFRKSLEKRFSEIERPWIFAPLGIIFQEGMDSDYENSVIRKVMAGLSISTTIALLLLVSAIGVRIAGLEKIKNNEQKAYQSLHDIALASLVIKGRILSAVKRKEDLRKTALLPISETNSEGEQDDETNSEGGQDDAKTPEELIALENAHIFSLMNIELKPLYEKIIMPEGYSTRSEEDDPGSEEDDPGSEEDNPGSEEDRANSSQDESLLPEDKSQELNSVIARVRKDDNDSKLTIDGIFVYYDDNTTLEEINASIQDGRELLNAISTQLSIINNSYFFEEDGVDDDLSIILFVAAIGVLGSVISILIRVQDIDQDTRFVGSNLDGSTPTEEIDPLKPVLGGLFRPFIGAFSSLFIFAAIKSGIVTLSFLSAGNAFYFFTVVSFVSGFSERLFVSVIAKATNSFDVNEPEPKVQKLSTVIVEDSEPALQSEETQDTTFPEENSEEGSFLKEKDKESES